MHRSFITALLLTVALFAAQGQAPQSPVSTAADAPESTPTPFETAQNLAARGRLDKAMAQLDRLTAQNPEPAGVERLRGMIFYQRDQFPQAIEAFTRAATQDPNDSASIEMHGVSLFRMDAFNAFNHITAGLPNGNIESGGSIGGEGGGCGQGSDCGPRQLEFSLHVQF